MTPLLALHSNRGLHHLPRRLHLPELHSCQSSVVTLIESATTGTNFTQVGENHDSSLYCLYVFCGIYSMLDNPHTHLSGVCKPYQALSELSLLHLVDSKHIEFGAITERNTTHC